MKKLSESNLEGGDNMENNNQLQEIEVSWSDINRAECEEASLNDMCSWAEAN